MALHPAATLALLIAAVVALFASASAADVLPRFWDPCHEWGAGSNQDSRTVDLNDECPSRSGSSQSRSEAALNLVAIQGMLLLAAGSIARGALRLDRVWVGAGGTIIAAMVPPFGLGILWLLVLILAGTVFATGCAVAPAAARYGNP